MTNEELVEKGFVRNQYTEQPTQPVMYTYETTDQSQIAVLLYALQDDFEMKSNQMYTAWIEIMQDRSVIQYLIRNQQDSLDCTHDKLEKNEFDAIVQLVHALNTINNQQTSQLDVYSLYPQQTMLVHQKKSDLLSLLNTEQQEEELNKVKAELLASEKDRAIMKEIIDNIEWELTGDNSDKHTETDFTNYVEDQINSYAFNPDRIDYYPNRLKTNQNIAFAFDPERYHIQAEIAADKEVDIKKSAEHNRLLLVNETSLNDPHLLQIFDRDSGITHQLTIEADESKEKVYQRLCERIKDIETDIKTTTENK